MPRKRRTREHQIADLSTNHVERFAILAGYSAERIEHDYGYDLNIYTHDVNGESENGYFFIQLKASDAPSYLKDGKSVTFDVEKAHLEQWLSEPFPVILALYDVGKDLAYWLYVQRYFECIAGFKIDDVRTTCTVRLPVTNIVDVNAMKEFAKCKDLILSQIEGVISHA